MAGQFTWLGCDEHQKYQNEFMFLKCEFAGFLSR